MAVPELARRLNLPARTWYNYETGVTVPAEVLLGFIDQTGANPTWLLTGEGARYRHSREERQLSEMAPVEMIRRGLEELERSIPNGVAIVAPENLPSHETSEFVAIGLYPLSEIANPRLDHANAHGHVLAYRNWLPNPGADCRNAFDRRRDAPDFAHRLNRGRRPVNHQSGRPSRSDCRGVPDQAPLDTLARRQRSSHDLSTQPNGQRLSTDSG